MDICDEIAKVAYEIFEREGMIHGRHLEHWCEAEIIVMKKYELETAQKNAVRSKTKKSSVKKPTEKKEKAASKKPEKTAKPKTKKA